MRCFVSVDVPNKVKEEIVKIQKKLPKFKGKITEPENLHLTLKFLGENDEVKLEKVRERLSKIKFKGFEAEINSLGVFDNQRSRRFSRKIIVWLKLENCDELQKKVDEALSGLFEREKRFMSHLTIARVKDVKDKKLFVQELEKIRLPKISFNVDCFKLKKSVLKDKGPEYETIEKYILN